MAGTATARPSLAELVEDGLEYLAKNVATALHEMHRLITATLHYMLPGSAEFMNDCYLMHVEFVAEVMRDSARMNQLNPAILLNLVICKEGGGG